MKKPTYSFFSNAKISIKEKEILSICKSKNILDVGCVGQVKHFSGESWLHGKMTKVSASVTGVDIDKKGVEEINNRGFKCLHLSELTNSNVKFDVIVMADVIEHVGNVEEFVNFYLNFLNKQGVIVITTPNPFSFRQTLSVLLFAKPSVNSEHTCWLDPITLSEVFKRLNLKINSFIWLKEYDKPKSLTSHLIHLISRLFSILRKFYCPNFLFIISK